MEFKQLTLFEKKMFPQLSQRDSTLSKGTGLENRGLLFQFLSTARSDLYARIRIQEKPESCWVWFQNQQNKTKHKQPKRFPRLLLGLRSKRKDYHPETSPSPAYHFPLPQMAGIVTLWSGKLMWLHLLSYFFSVRKKNISICCLYQIFN